MLCQLSYSYGLVVRWSTRGSNAQVWLDLEQCVFYLASGDWGEGEITLWDGTKKSGQVLVCPKLKLHFIIWLSPLEVQSGILQEIICTTTWWPYPKNCVYKIVNVLLYIALFKSLFTTQRTFTLNVLHSHTCLSVALTSHGTASVSICGWVFLLRDNVMTCYDNVMTMLTAGSRIQPGIVQSLDDRSTKVKVL